MSASLALSSLSPLAADLHKLNAIRLARDWSMRELSNHMTARGFKVSTRVLHYLLTNPDPAHRPYDRTQYKIREYLAHVRRQDRRHRQAKITKAAQTNGRG